MTRRGRPPGSASDPYSPSALHALAIDNKVLDCMEGVGARFGEIVCETRLSRGVVWWSLRRLMSRGEVRKGPGYGWYAPVEISRQNGE